MIGNEFSVEGFIEEMFRYPSDWTDHGEKIRSSGLYDHPQESARLLIRELEKRLVSIGWTDSQVMNGQILATHALREMALKDNLSLAALVPILADSIARPKSSRCRERPLQTALVAALAAVKEKTALRIFTRMLGRCYCSGVAQGIAEVEPDLATTLPLLYRWLEKREPEYRKRALTVILDLIKFDKAELIDAARVEHASDRENVAENATLFASVIGSLSKVEAVPRLVGLLKRFRTVQTADAVIKALTAMPAHELPRDAVRVAVCCLYSKNDELHKQGAHLLRMIGRKRTAALRKK